jgi:tRNA threonylcarbamoyladenosine biosynthesis protein TsaB
MKFLAIDSTGAVATCALLENEELIAKKKVNSGLKHSEILLPMIKKMLDESNLAVSDIDIFVCSVGPGSFTGVRIGAATIKGLAFGRKACVGVSSLEALAYSLTDKEGIISAVMDARRDQLYNALFKCSGGNIERITDDRVVSADELANELAEYDCDVYLVGDGYSVAMKAVKSENVKETPEDQRDADAEGVARLGLKVYKESGAVSDLELLPTYLRVPQAERERNERLMKEMASSK